MASDRPRVTEEHDRDTLKELALQILDAAGSVRGAREAMLKVLHTIEPFSSYPELTTELVREIEHAK
jgi:hypothetical protein